MNPLPPSSPIFYTFTEIKMAIPISLIILILPMNSLVIALVKLRMHSWTMIVKRSTFQNPKLALRKRRKSYLN